MSTVVTGARAATVAAARSIRRRIIAMATRELVHVGAALSLADVLAVLYGGHLRRVAPGGLQDPLRDRLILSKGHGCLALYAALCERGILPESLLDELGSPGNPLGGHPGHELPGVELSTGALGHGLAVGAGLALAARLDGNPSETVVLLGDGELDEGSVWEAALFAAHQGLGGLLAVVDRNGLQQEGPTEKILALEPLPAKWRAFGWQVEEVDGHDHDQLAAAFASARALALRRGPTVVIARTVKGKGVSFMENDPAWHMRHLTCEEADRACRELGAEVCCEG